MSGLSNTAKQYLMKFYFGGITPSAFSEWLFKAKDVETVIGEDAYFQLIDLDYAVRSDVESAKEHAKNIYNSLSDNRLVKDWAESVLSQMLAGAMGLDVGCKILGDLRNDGCSFIPIVFVGYGSELEDSSKLEFYRERIVGDAKQLLLELKK